MFESHEQKGLWRMDMIVLRSSGPITYPPLPRGALAARLAVREAGPAGVPKPLRAAIRARHYSRRTEKTYVAWIRRYIFFHGKRHPAEMGAAEVSRFLTSLAVGGEKEQAPCFSGRLLGERAYRATVITMHRSARSQYRSR